MAAQKKSMPRASLAKKAGAEKSAGDKPHSHQDQRDALPVDRRASRDRRSHAERRSHDEPVAVERRVLQRRAKVNRRRQIDPTTCERDYTPDEVEFMGALDQYKRISGRMFPTCSEVLEVLKKLGYEKHSPAETAHSGPAAAVVAVDLPAPAAPQAAIV